MTVTVYTKSNCQPCRMTKKKFDTIEIDYSVVNIDEDEKAQAYVASLGYTAVPVVVVELGDDVDWTWSGFRPHYIDQLKEIR